MHYDVALERAFKELEGINPYAACAKSGANYEAGRFELRFFGRTFFIHYPEIKVEEVDTKTPPPPWLQVLLLHYLVRAKGIPVADEWISYRHLPGASLFEGRFRQMAIDPLVRAFGTDIDSFRKAGLALGGEPLTRSGDAAFRLLALPRIPVACILYLGEEEIPPSVNILFDAASHTYLPTEDLSWVGAYLSGALQQSLQR